MGNVLFLKLSNSFTDLSKLDQTDEHNIFLGDISFLLVIYNLSHRSKEEWFRGFPDLHDWYS